MGNCAKSKLTTTEQEVPPLKPQPDESEQKVEDVEIKLSRMNTTNAIHKQLLVKQSVRNLVKSAESEIAKKNMSQASQAVMDMLAAMSNCRTRAQIASDTHLPRDLLLDSSRFESFGSSPTQNPEHDNFEALREEAAQAKSVLDNALTSYLATKNLNPKAYIKVPLKTNESCSRKIEDDYGGNVLKLCDIVRCSVVLSDEAALANILSDLLSSSIDSISVFRLKNRFLHPLFTGI